MINTSNKYRMEEKFWNVSDIKLHVEWSRSNITRYWTHYEKKKPKICSGYELTCKKPTHTSPARASYGEFFAEKAPRDVGN